MCWQVYAAVGMKALGLWQENKARAQVAKSQAEDATLSMNYQLMNYEQARADAYDEVVGEIIKTRQNSMQLNSQVNAAVAEEMAGGGRTADQIRRSAAGDTARTVFSIQDNYRRKSNEIDLNKYALYKQTEREIEGLKQKGKPNKLADILALAHTGVNTYQAAKSIRVNRKTGGGDKR